MTLRLSHRLMLLLALVCVLLSVGIGVYSRYSFTRGFRDYMGERERSGLEALSADLAGRYQENGGWQFLPTEPRDWQRYAASVLKLDTPPEFGGPPFDHGEPPPDDRFAPPPGQFPGQPMPGQEGSAQQGSDQRGSDQRGADQRDPDQRGPAHALHPMLDRLQLLDGEGHWLAGAQGEPIPGAMELLIHSEDRLIGRLRLARPPMPHEGPDARFQQDYLQQLLLSTAGALLFALLAAGWLARSLSRPIEQLAHNVDELRQGNFHTPVTVARSDELGTLASGVAALGETLAANERFRRNAMADISHELRTPVAILRGRIEAMQDAVVPADATSLASLHNNVLRLQHLIDDLHQLSLADAGGLTLNKTAVSLSELTREVVQEFSLMAEERQLQLRMEPLPEKTVFGDPMRLRQILLNLLQNSLRYTDAGGHIVIRIDVEHGFLLWSIEDSAPGVPLDELPRLFDRYYRAEKSRGRATGGAGLGLALVKTLVEAHGGRVTAEASRLGGLKIMLWLPVIRHE